MFSKLEEIAIVKNKKHLSQEEFLFKAKEGETYYLVPIFKGAGVEVAVGFAIGFAFSFASSMLQGASFGQALLRGFIGGAAGALGAYGFSYFATPATTVGVSSTFAGAAEGLVISAGGPTIGSYAAAGLASAVGSILQNTLVPIKPKSQTVDSADSGDRPGNDAFDAQINTVASNQLIPLNYGLLRLGGQIISADVDTINHGKDEQIKVVDHV